MNPRAPRRGARDRRLPFLFAFMSLAPAGASAELPPLLPRETFFPKPPARQSLRLSPGGGLLSYVAADSAGTPQLWLQDADAPGTYRQLTRVPSPGVGSYAWAEDGLLIAYEPRDTGAARLVGIEPGSGRERVLLDIAGARLGSVLTRPGVPGQMLVIVRLKDATDDDVYRIDLATSSVTLDTKNPGRVSGSRFFADPALVVRAAQRTMEDGAYEVLVREGPDAPWRQWLTLDSTYDLAVLGFTGDGQSLLLRTDRHADKSQLVERRLTDGSERVIAGASDLDLEDVLVHPRSLEVQAVSYYADPRRFEFLDPALRADFQLMKKSLTREPAQLWFLGRDRADARWLVGTLGDRRSARFYLWRRDSRRATFVYEPQPQFSTLPLGREQSIAFDARDGVRIRGYLTLPVAVPPKDLPLVLWVHGGPYLRDGWGLDPLGQFFVNRGYAFLRVNYRGSRGFGRTLRVSSFKQWGGTMQDDLVDAVEHVVRSGVVDRRRVAIAGHSYGGYAALAALTLTPELFRCAAASSTTSNLVEFVSRFPKTPGNAWVRQTIGDPELPADADRLRSVSPFFQVDRLARPLLMASGDKDGSLPPGVQEAFLEEIAKRGGHAASVVYPGDGHFFRRENELDYYARVEQLFARHLGGRAESMPGERLPGATAVVRVVGTPFGP